MSRVLIIGASGLVGGGLYKHISTLNETVGTFKKFPLKDFVCLDITDRQGIQELISKVSPEYVFLPAALTNVDLCEEQSDFCQKINVQGVKNVVDVIRGISSKLIYFSSDYVFDGHNGPYAEDDIPSPLTEYGRSKLAAEQNIQLQLKNYLIIRTTCVYGWEAQGKNFVINLINKSKSPSVVEVPCDQITSPTYVGNLASITWELARRDKIGIYNVVDDSILSRLEFALTVADIFGLDKSLIRGVTTESMKRKASRPLNAGLKTGKIKKEMDLRINDVRRSLLLMQREKR